MAVERKQLEDWKNRLNGKYVFLSLNPLRSLLHATVVQMLTYIKIILSFPIFFQHTSLSVSYKRLDSEY